MTEPARHGTRGAYQTCRKRPGGACDDCRAANADYHAERRRRQREHDDETEGEEG